MHARGGTQCEVVHQSKVSKWLVSHTGLAYAATIATYNNVLFTMESRSITKRYQLESNGPERAEN